MLRVWPGGWVMPRMAKRYHLISPERPLSTGPNWVFHTLCTSTFTLHAQTLPATIEETPRPDQCSACHMHALRRLKKSEAR